MQKLQTKLQMKNANLPTQLEFLEVLSRRGSSYFNEEKKLYKSLQAGTEGEQKLLQYLFAFGMSHWIVLQNVWFNHFRIFECDLLLITRHCIYIFEVKNYRGTFSYKDGKCYFNEEESPLNPFEQVRANAVSVRNYLKRLNINIPVKAAVIFTGKDNEVQIHSEIEDIEAVQSAGIRNFILRLVSEEKQSPPHSIHPNHLIEKLEQIETSSPYMPDPLSEDSLREIKGGIYCGNCLSFKFQKTKTAIKCSCGLKESLEEAVIRTICDYSILNYTRKISQIELIKFLNKQVSITYLGTLLPNHFETEKQSRRVHYNIPARAYENNRDHFFIKQPRVFHHENGDIHLLK